jgi:CheY-like chemotaxis protein
MTKILVIDDDDAVRENLVELLTMEGYEVIAAEDGAAGITLAIERCPDLVICDVNMPGQDGFEVFEVLSGQSETAVTPSSSCRRAPDVRTCGVAWRSERTTSSPSLLRGSNCWSRWRLACVGAR